MTDGTAASPRYLAPKQAAHYLGIGYSTLTIHRMHGTGPKYIRWSSNIRYDVAELDKWMQQHSVTPVPKPVAVKRGRPRKRKPAA